MEVPFLSGAEALSNQTFLDLFDSETIVAGEGLTVRRLALLFTDLQGSTALYDRIGDMKAFDLVRLHFGHLRECIARNSGALVKTIGDAVMASFVDPLARQQPGWRRPQNLHVRGPDNPVGCAGKESATLARLLEGWRDAQQWHGSMSSKRCTGPGVRRCGGWRTRSPATRRRRGTSCRRHSRRRSARQVARGHDHL